MAVELFSGPRITGCGMYAPETVITNDALIKKYGIDSTDEWIRTNVGVGSRHILQDRSKATAFMSIQAAKAALKDANLKANKIDGIILATVTGDYGSIPGTAPLVQEALGIDGFAFDVNAGCSGFVHALIVAKNLIETGGYRRIMVGGADTLSRVTNWQDRNTCILFGDGAGVVVMEYSDTPVMRMSYDMKSLGNASVLFTPAGGTLEPLTSKALLENEHCIHMDGRTVGRTAVREMYDSMHATMDKAGIKLNQIDFIIPHQANINIIKNLIKREKLDPEQVIVWLKTQKKFENSPREQSGPEVLVNIDRYGNTSAASIPIALAEADAEGVIKSNDRLMLTAFGAGLTRASMYLKWKEDENGTTPKKLYGRARRIFNIPFALMRSLAEKPEMQKGNQ